MQLQSLCWCGRNSVAHSWGAVKTTVPTETIFYMSWQCKCSRWQSKSLSAAFNLLYQIISLYSCICTRMLRMCMPHACYIKIWKPKMWKKMGLLKLPRFLSTTQRHIPPPIWKRLTPWSLAGACSSRGNWQLWGKYNKHNQGAHVFPKQVETKHTYCILSLRWQCLTMLYVTEFRHGEKQSDMSCAGWSQTHDCGSATVAHILAF